MPGGLIGSMKALFEGDPGVRKVADDPALSAELLLLLRMALADGRVSEREMEMFRRICLEAFGIGGESFEAILGYLDDFGYETNGAQAMALFRGLRIERRKLLARHLADMAKADAVLAEDEMRMLRRALDALGLEPGDAVRPAVG